MTIGHPPQREERTLEILIYHRDLTPSDPTHQGVIFYILIYFTVSFHHQNPLFSSNLKIQNKFTILALTANHLHEENPSLCSTLEPLYYGSYATVVGEI